ncbi:hypothetical protein [Planctomicrobium piriforme]|uniref:Uncharacterized protein n=1 Tax=Planctomicrobium piriforme TaxID=1576369 RepID=A0A1I3QSW9_9PLAN|nr:hypothetical protein [Planctomicrobium piriforme]SFJ37373.1 hypothetical protein SAMN05421753_11944 [Planctomicrobium piriforme]
MLRTLLILLSLAPLCAAGEPIALPDDPSAAVVELWYVQNGQLKEPEVAVFASGRVRVNVGDGSLWGDLTPAELQSLLTDLLNRDGIAALRTEAIQTEIEAASTRTGLSCVIDQSGDTIIRIRTATTVYRVDGHAVGLLAARFPEVASLQQLYAAQRRLENVRAVVMVGGPAAAERLAKLAQSQIQVNHSEHLEVTPQNLSMVRSLADGTRFCQFLIPCVREDRPSDRVISVFECPGEAPRVSVLPDGPALR